MIDPRTANTDVLLSSYELIEGGDPISTEEAMIRKRVQARAWAALRSAWWILEFVRGVASCWD